MSIPMLLPENYDFHFLKVIKFFSTRNIIILCVYSNFKVKLATHKFYLLYRQRWCSTLLKTLSCLTLLELLAIVFCMFYEYRYYCFTRTRWREAPPRDWESCVNTKKLMTGISCLKTHGSRTVNFCTHINHLTLGVIHILRNHQGGRGVSEWLR